MCIIIDANCLASVLDETSTDHREFKPVFDWICYNKGKIVWGGTKYSKEIGKYLGVFKELRNINKTTYIEDARVDGRTNIVSRRVKHKNFNDQHLVGLLLESGCKLICSLDKEAYPFFRHEEFFKPANRKPKIYRGKSNKDLLIRPNIAEICEPCFTTTKAQKEVLKTIFNRI